MGAVMAPAAAELIAQNLTDFKRKPEDYDRIITGDLGEVGQQILFDLLLKKGMDIRKQHEDCGMLIFDSQTQGTGSGGSGCGCAASVLQMCLRERNIMDQKIKRMKRTVIFM